MYKFLEHTADVKIKVEAKDMNTAFIESARAMKEAILDKIKIQSKIQKKIKVQGKDKEALLYNFLEEFLFLLDAKNFIFSEVKGLNISKKEKYELEAIVYGDKANKYDFSNDIKAVTYNDMKISEKKNKVGIIFVLDA